MSKCELCKGNLTRTPYKYKGDPLFECEACEEEYI